MVHAASQTSPVILLDFSVPGTWPSCPLSPTVLPSFNPIAAAQILPSGLRRTPVTISCSPGHLDPWDGELWPSEPQQGCVPTLGSSAAAAHPWNPLHSPTPRSLFFLALFHSHWCHPMSLLCPLLCFVFLHDTYCSSSLNGTICNRCLKNICGMNMWKKAALFSPQLMVLTLVGAFLGTMWRPSDRDCNLFHPSLLLTQKTNKQSTTSCATAGSGVRGEMEKGGSEVGHPTQSIGAGERVQFSKRKHEPQTLQIIFPKHTFSKPGIWSE